MTYLKLENLVSKFRKPCVVDIKMGKKTYDPEAGPAKIAKEMTKFPHVEKFGFQFTGMQVGILIFCKLNVYFMFILNIYYTAFDDTCMSLKYFLPFVLE